MRSHIEIISGLFAGKIIAKINVNTKAPSIFSLLKISRSSVR